MRSVERAREIRLWVVQIAVPTVLGVSYILSNKETKEKVKNTVYKLFHRKGL